MTMPLKEIKIDEAVYEIFNIAFQTNKIQGICTAKNIGTLQVYWKSCLQYKSAVIIKPVAKKPIINHTLENKQGYKFMELQGCCLSFPLQC